MMCKDTCVRRTSSGQGKEISKRKLLGIAGLGWLFDAMDVGMLSFVMVALQKDWGLSTQEMGWIGSINSIGMAVGRLFWDTIR